MMELKLWVVMVLPESFTGLSHREKSEYIERDSYPRELGNIILPSQYKTFTNERSADQFSEVLSTTKKKTDMVFRQCITVSLEEFFCFGEGLKFNSGEREGENAK